MKFSVIVFSAIWLTCNAAFSQTSKNPDSVQFLYQACRADLASALGRYCLGYAEGAGQMMVINGHQGYEMGLCPPATIGVPSGGALVQAFLNWAEKHPEMWSESALVGFAVAMSTTWSCKKSN